MTDTPFGNSFFNVRSAEKCTVFVLGGPVPVGRLSSQPTASACSSCRSLATRWCGLGPLTMWVIHTVVGQLVLKSLLLADPTHGNGLVVSTAQLSQTCSGAETAVCAFPRKMVSASRGKITTDRIPAAIRAASEALAINPSCIPICAAATMKESDVACKSASTLVWRFPP